MSQSGYGVTRHHLVSIGEIGGFFGAVVEAGSHDHAIAMVRDRSVDATAIDSHVLELAMDLDPSLADEVLVVDTLGPSTIQPIMVTKRLGLDIRRAIRRALTTLHRDDTMRQVLARGRIERFVAIGSEDYDDVRLMLDECQRADFIEIR